MKKYFSQLRPLERRLVVGVAVVVLIVLNAWFIWPHFKDWGDLQGRLAKARGELARNQAAVAKIPVLQAEVKKFESEGEFVALEDQSVNFMRTIQSQSSASGVAIANTSRQLTRTNDVFFIEQ
ncbi:MAG: hypothetical protein WCH99_21140, partial [Verrucomicrobiota bacterium]